MSKHNFQLTPIAAACGTSLLSTALDVPPPSVRKLNTKHTLTAHQYEIILLLLSSGPKNTFEFRRAGVAHPAMRLKELRDKYGCTIETDLISIIDEFGFPHARVARYTLIDAPKVLA